MHYIPPNEEARLREAEGHWWRQVLTGWGQPILALCPLPPDVSTRGVQYFLPHYITHHLNQGVRQSLVLATEGSRRPSPSTPLPTPVTRARFSRRFSTSAPAATSHSASVRTPPRPPLEGSDPYALDVTRQTTAASSQPLHPPVAVGD